MGRTLMLITIAGLSCLLVLWLVAPRLLPVGQQPSGAGGQGAMGGQNNSAPDAQHLTPPQASPSTTLPPITASGTPGNVPLPNMQPVLTPEQQAVADYEAKRAPFYKFLREQCGKLVVDGSPALEDRSILVLHATRNDATIVTDLLTHVVIPYAYAYGFRHVRFYLPNPPGSVEHYHLAAEANADSNGNWQAFQK